MMDLVVLALLWIVFCVVHSWLISLKVTGFVENYLPGLRKYYRLLYNIIALLTIVPPVLYSRNLDYGVFFNWAGNWRYVKLFLLIIAGIYAVGGALVFNLFDFIGFGQLFNGGKKKLAGIGNTIEYKGILAYVRHPWYAAAIILLWAWPISFTTLVENAILCSYLVIGTYIEEQKLVKTFGNAYVEYQQKVSMYFPWKAMVKPVKAKS